MNNKTLDAMLRRGLSKVTKNYVREKKKTRRGRSLSLTAIKRLSRKRYMEISLREATFKIMTEAYLAASAGGTLPANARQIMYRARPLVLKLRDEVWKNSSTFTQSLLPDYIGRYPSETARWDVVYDARGHLKEPHTDRRIDLGTLAVRRYVGNWITKTPDLIINPIGLGVETEGPGNRYKCALLIEKEGFDPLLDHAQISQRYDVAIMSTKGMGSTSARQLVEELTLHGVTTLVAHDCDKWGFSICHRLQTNTKRFRFSVSPKVVCLGLRYDDARAMGLDSEPVHYSRFCSKYKLKESGATDDEAAFMAGDGRNGQRIELNAMDSQQFIDWLEERLLANGVTKVVPNSEVLEAAYRRAVLVGRANKALAAVQQEWNTNGHSRIEIPDDLAEQIQELLENSNRSWDMAVLDLACPPEEDAPTESDKRVLD
jgi:hypothetical protein